MKIDPVRLTLSQETLKHFFHYDPKTGQMTRIRRLDSWGGETTCRIPITGKNNRGYFWVSIRRVMYLAHRLAFLYMTGKHPKNEVDHINGIRLDNRWKNLRQVASFQNSRNQGVRKDCTSGTRGVTYSNRADKWLARISHKDIRYNLGYFLNKRDAIAARLAAEIKYGYHPNHAKRQAWHE